MHEARDSPSKVPPSANPAYRIEAPVPSGTAARYEHDCIEGGGTASTSSGGGGGGPAQSSTAKEEEIGIDIGRAALAYRALPNLHPAPPIPLQGGRVGSWVGCGGQCTGTRGSVCTFFFGKFSVSIFLVWCLRVVVLYSSSLYQSISLFRCLSHSHFVALSSVHSCVRLYECVLCV